MSVKINKDVYKEKASAVIFGTILGVLISLLSVFAFSVLYTVLDIEEYFCAVFATLSLVVGSFSGAAFAVNRIKHKGFLFGSLVGITVFVIMFTVALITAEGSFSLTSLFHFVCCTISGGISGIIRVNKEVNKKYLK